MNKEKNPSVVTFGEVMLRLSTPAFARFTQATSFLVTYAGAEANVAVSLQNFGIPSAHVTKFPDNDLGYAATQALRKVGVNTNGIVYGNERMGVYFLENGAIQRASRIIYDRFDSAFAYIKPGEINWNEILEDVKWFHYTGITPAISQGAADVCLEGLRIAKKKGITVSGDINYRRNLWQYGKSAREIMPELVKLTDVVIAGITDMENCCGISGNNYEEACKAMMKAYPSIQKIASTERNSISSSHNEIAAVMWNGKKLLTSKTYDLTHIVDRIGAGDAFMGGLIYGLITGKDDQQSLEFATAACAWKHTVEGDVNIASTAEIEHLVSGENVGKLLR